MDQASRAKWVRAGASSHPVEAGEHHLVSNPVDETGRLVAFENEVRTPCDEGRVVGGDGEERDRRGVLTDRKRRLDQRILIRVLDIVQAKETFAHHRTVAQGDGALLAYPWACVSPFDAHVR